MGHALKKVFDLIELKTGFKGRVKLSSMSGIPSDKAESHTDDNETLAKVKGFASEILGEDVEALLNQ